MCKHSQSPVACSRCSSRVLLGLLIIGSATFAAGAGNEASEGQGAHGAVKRQWSDTLKLDPGLKTLPSHGIPAVVLSAPAGAVRLNFAKTGHYALPSPARRSEEHEDGHGGHEHEHEDHPEDEHGAHDEHEHEHGADEHEDEHGAHDEHEDGGLRGAELWGFAILGGLVSAAMAFGGILFVAIKPHANFHESHTLRAYLSSFGVGVLMGLIFVHLIPEGAELAGGYGHKNWLYPMCLLIGFFLAVFVQHMLSFLGFKRTCKCSPPMPEEPCPEFDNGAGVFNDSRKAAHVRAPKYTIGTSPTNLACPPMWPTPTPLHAHAPYGAVGASCCPPHTPRYPPSEVHTQAEELFSPRNHTKAGCPAAGPQGPQQAPSDVVDMDVEKGQHNSNASWYGLTDAQASLALNMFIGDFLCNFVDGIVTGAAFWECGVTTGFLVAVAICMHELPQEISDFLILRNAGLSFAKALGANLLCSTATLLGVIIMVATVTNADSSQVGQVGYALAIGSGFLIHVAVSLLPSARQTKSLKELVVSWCFLLTGCVIMFVVLVFHPECGHHHDH